MNLLATLLLAFHFLAAVSAQQWPLHDDGQTDLIQWDHYSVIVNDQRLFVWSGEMHYWRIPVPELWLDILQKVKAAGFNTVSFYSHWGEVFVTLSCLPILISSRIPFRSQWYFGL